MLKNDLLLRAARRERTERTPVWLMRQAGRFDPEYQRIRQDAGMPLEDLFRHAEHSAKISLLPKRFGVDAIIFFQDILTPLSAMGAPFLFRPGPVLESPIRGSDDVARLRLFDPAEKMKFVPQTLKLVLEELNGDLPLLGFAGAPLTLAFFLIEGGSPGSDAPHARALMRDAPQTMHRLLRLLTDMTVDYLGLQVEAGVHALQLFESVADMLSPGEYSVFAHPYHQEIFSKLDGRERGQVPKILFAKECPHVELMANSGADVISVGACVDIAGAKRRFGSKVALQGNVDNRVLLEGPAERIEKAVHACIEQGGGEGHILNLNHGVLKDTPLENVCRLIDTAKAARVHSKPAAARAE